MGTTIVCLASVEAYYSAEPSAIGYGSLEAVVAAAMLGAALGHWPRRSTKSLADPD